MFAWSHLLFVKQHHPSEKDKNMKNNKKNYSAWHLMNTILRPTKSVIMMTESRVNAQSFGQPLMIIKANKAISLRLSLYCSSSVSKQILTLEALLVTDILKDKPSLSQSQTVKPANCLYN